MKLSNGEPGQFLDGRPEAFCMIASKGSLPFLPAAKPTGLVELNVLSFFLLLSVRFQKEVKTAKINMVA